MAFYLVTKVGTKRQNQKTEPKDRTKRQNQKTEPKERINRMYQKARKDRILRSDKK